MINIKNYITEYLNNDKINGWYKIKNNIKLIEKFSYYNIRHTFLNSIKNRFQYKIIEIPEDQELINKIIQTRAEIKNKEYDIIINGTVSDEYTYANCDLLVKGKLLRNKKKDLIINDNLYYPLYICTFFNKPDINKYVNLKKYEKLGEEYLRLLNINQNKKVIHYIICPYHRWNGNETLIYKECENPNLEFKNWINDVLKLSYDDLLDVKKIKPFYKYDINDFEKDLLIKRKDVRLLCGIGPKITQILYKEHNIYSWDNPRFIKTIENILSKNKSSFIKKILNFNKTGKEIEYLNKFNGNLYKNNKINFFVDFETFGKKKMQGGIEMLYLIGLYSVVNNNENIKRFHYFMAEKKTIEEEKNICEQWINCMLKYKTYYKVNKKIKIYHWGHMERSYFNKVLNRQSELDRELFFNNFEFIDLCNVLTINKFIFKDFISGYSIKNISKILYKYGKIPISYNQSECKNGFDSFELGIKYYNGNIESRYKVIKYNEIDCKTIYYILKYILEVLDRKN
jgi:hypothetical protein